ncbi:signal peptidase I [Planomonospora algeriensis]
MTVPTGLHRLGRTAWRVADVVARLTRGMVVFFLLVSLVPMLFGWQSQAIMSGSMMPLLRPGDIVIVEPTGADQAVPGMMVLVDNPARPGSTLIHRVVEHAPGKALITKGDANEDIDSTPVPESSVIGLPRLLVPYIGLPAVWLHERQYGLLALTGLLGLALISVPSVTKNPRPNSSKEGRRRR